MKKLLLPLFASLLLLAACNENKPPTDLTSLNGVWANADCELVQTGKYTLLFERNGDKITTTLRQNKQSNGTVYTCYLSGMQFDVNTKEYMPIECPASEIKLPVGDYLQIIDGQLEIKRKSAPVKLQLVEKIDICPAYEMPVANAKNVGECLQNWQLGTIEHSLEPDNFHIEIATNKHSYIYLVSPAMTYCRTARLRSNNNGSVFAQNIRLMINSNTHEATAYMGKNNLAITAADVTIDNSLFKPDQCSFEEGGIYWSLISYAAGIIELNGCGETYTYIRPTKDNKKIAEWFSYQPY